jgi:hypothetical protein
MQDRGGGTSVPHASVPDKAAKPRCSVEGGRPRQTTGDGRRLRVTSGSDGPTEAGHRSRWFRLRLGRRHPPRPGATSEPPSTIGRDDELARFRQLAGAEGTNPAAGLALAIVGSTGSGTRSLLEVFARVAGSRAPPRCAPIVELGGSTDLVEVLEQVALGLEPGPNVFRPFQSTLAKYRHRLEFGRSKWMARAEAARVGTSLAQETAPTMVTGIGKAIGGSAPALVGALELPRDLESVKRDFLRSRSLRPATGKPRSSSSCTASTARTRTGRRRNSTGCGGGSCATQPTPGRSSSSRWRPGRRSSSCPSVRRGEWPEPVYGYGGSATILAALEGALQTAPPSTTVVLVASGDLRRHVRRLVAAQYPGLVVVARRHDGAASRTMMPGASRAVRGQSLVKRRPKTPTTIGDVDSVESGRSRPSETDRDPSRTLSPRSHPGGRRFESG